MSATSTRIRTRHHAIAEARRIAAEANDCQRSMTGLEREAFARALDDVERLAIPRATEYRSRPLDLDRPMMRSDDARRAAFGKWLAAGKNALSQDEYRALSAGDDVSGGFLITPMQTTVDVLTKLDDLLFMRAKGTVLPPMPMTSDAVAVTVVDTSPDDGTWTAEITGTSFDTAMRTGQRVLTPRMVSRGIKVSERLLRISAGRAESIVADRIAYAVARPAERGYVAGTGAAQPLGIFTASVHGISTARDIATGSTTTAVTGDSFVYARFNLKGQYQAGAEWVTHREVLRAATLLKDGNGRYIWEAAETAGEPDMILGKPVNMSEFAPNTFTTGQYVAVFGDLSFYQIVDMQTDLQRLTELYAGTNEVAFIARVYTDGMPTVEEAFTRMALA